mgnify:CR=1 FL=1
MTPFDEGYYEEFCKEYAVRITDESANGISYKFVEMKDRWVAIFEIDKTTWKKYPKIQAMDREKALSYIEMIEPLNVPVQIIA